MTFLVITEDHVGQSMKVGIDLLCTCVDQSVIVSLRVHSSL